MAARTRDHEPPAAPAFAAVVLGCIAAGLAVVVPAESMVSRIVLCALFGILALLSGWRAIAIAGRRRGPRIWASIGIVIAAAGLLSLGWQVLVVLTDGAFPSPPWSPFSHR